MPPKGQKQSLEARAKVSAARSVPKVKCTCQSCGKLVLRDRSEMKRRKMTFCDKKCESEYRTGIKQSEETCLKKSLSQKGRIFSDAHKNKIRVGTNLRWEKSEERKRMSKIATGRIMSDEARENMSESRKRVLAEDPTLKVRALEGMIGGFWYGNVKYWYTETPQYCEKFTKEFKERVRAYRGYVCFECGTPQNGKKLGVHHVHYDKKMCCNGSPRDVVTLCGQCHSKTNYNRKFWEEYFTEMIYDYDPTGKCYFTKEEMINFNGG